MHKTGTRLDLHQLNREALLAALTTSDHSVFNQDTKDLNCVLCLSTCDFINISINAENQVIPKGSRMKKT